MVCERKQVGLWRGREEKTLWAFHFFFFFDVVAFTGLVQLVLTRGFSLCGDGCHFNCRNSELL